jgi:hypothetical protein
MSDSYPLPHYAASVWLSGDKLMVAFPPLPGNIKGHTVALPSTAAGFAVLQESLRERQRDGYQKLGTKAVPVQYDIDEMIRRMGPNAVEVIPAKIKKQNAPHTLTLSDLDMDEEFES